MICRRTAAGYSPGGNLLATIFLRPRRVGGTEAVPLFVIVQQAPGTCLGFLPRPLDVGSSLSAPCPHHQGDLV
jgi:hypothetical protein